MKTTKIAILDDHAALNEGVKVILEKLPNIEFCGSFLTASDLFNYLKGNELDVLLCDLNMPDMSGFDVIANMKKWHPKTKTLAFSARNDENSIKRVFLQGGKGFVSKDEDIDEIVVAINTVRGGSYYIPYKFQGSVIELMFENSETQAKLSNRETQILKLICEEKTSQEIAEELDISENTVHNHRKSLTTKLKVKNVAGLIKYAYLNGLVD